MPRLPSRRQLTWGAAAAELFLLPVAVAAEPAPSPAPNPEPAVAAPAPAENTPPSPAPAAPAAAVETAAASTSAATTTSAVSSAGAVSSAVATQNPLEERVKELEETVRQLKEALRQVQSPPARPAEAAQVEKLIDERLKKQTPLAGFDRGFFVRSADGQHRLRIGGLVHTDARAFGGGSGRTGTDSFFLRRVRPILEGTVYKNIDFRIMPDFGGGAAVLQDAYMDIRFRPEARLRAGKFKEPFSLERLQSAQDMHFIERSIAQNLAPNRDVGFQVHGDLFRGTVSYAVGAFNGVNDGGSSDGDAANDKDVVGRVFAEPFKNREGSALQGLGLGIAGTFGRRSEGPGGVTFRTAGRSAFFRYLTAGAGAVTGGDEQWRLAPQFYYYTGPFGLMGEYLVSGQEIRNAANSGEVTNSGWFLQASYVLTGEKNSFRGITPKRPFDPQAGRWGALEVGARYSRIDFDQDAFRLGFANPATSVSGAAAWTFGLNWHLNRAIKVMFNYERTTFNRGITFAPGVRDREDVFLTRFQVAF